jgi:hypothetical protein
VQEPTLHEILTEVAATGQPYRVGRNRPPLETRWRSGVSGNPGGRPPRASLGGSGARRAVAPEPSAIEQALAEPVMYAALDAEGPVPLARAVVARLTRRALEDGDVAACRELLRLCAEADGLRVERDLIKAEREAAEAARAQAAAAAEQAKAAKAAERNVDQEAYDLLVELARDAALQAEEEEMANEVRALKLLGAVEEAEDEFIDGLRPWVIEAARAHDPAAARRRAAPDVGNAREALEQLGILVMERGFNRLAGWFIDAARARRPGATFAEGDEALLQLVRAEAGEPADWQARWCAAVLEPTWPDLDAESPAAGET